MTASAHGSGLPGSPTMESLADPEWVAAYRAAGGGSVADHSGLTPQQAIVAATALPRVVPRRAVAARNSVAILRRRAVSASAMPAASAAPVVERLKVVEDEPPLVTERETDAVIAEVKAASIEWLEFACPKVVGRMSGAHDAIMRGDPESLSHGLTSCRRALEALAEHLYPARDGTVVRDRSGHERKIGRDHWKNRLLLFIEDHATSRTSRLIEISRLELLVDHLDPLVEKFGKGVHHDVRLGEAQQAYASTWLLIAEVVRLAR